MNNTSSIKTTSTAKFSDKIVLAIIISMISVPIGALYLGFSILSSKYRCSQSAEKSLFILLTLALGYINMSKPAQDSDLAYYYWLYNFAGEKSIGEYFRLIPKEPLYHIFNYIMYYVTFGNFRLFMMVYTAIVYILIYQSYVILSQRFKINANYIIGAVLMMSLFSEFQFYSSQIMRQVLAGAIAIYGISRLTAGKGKKISLLIIFCAGLFHASAFFFLIFYILYFTNRWKFSYQLILFFALLLGYVSVLKFLGGFVDDSSTIGLAVRRGTSVSQEVGSVSMFPLIICSSVLPMAFLIMMKVKNRLLRLYLLMPSALVVFILLNLGNSLYVLRFMEYIYMYIPIVLTLFLCVYTRNVKQIQLLAILALAIRFGLKLGMSNFSFLPLSEFLFSGFPVYLVKIFL